MKRVQPIEHDEKPAYAAGVSKPDISQIEGGKCCRHGGDAEEVAKVLRVPLDAL